MRCTGEYIVSWDFTSLSFRSTFCSDFGQFTPNLLQFWGKVWSKSAPQSAKSMSNRAVSARNGFLSNIWTAVSALSDWPKAFLYVLCCSLLIYLCLVLRKITRVFRKIWGVAEPPRISRGGGGVLNNVRCETSPLIGPFFYLVAICVSLSVCVFMCG